MKKIISTMLLLAIMCSAIITMPSEVRASEVTEQIIEESLFTDDEESNAVVYAYLTSTLRGVYLLEGSATISRLVQGIAICAGTTKANFAVSVVGITVTLERYVSSTAKWTSVNAWSAADYNTYYINLTKSQAVTGGSYYRVQTSHVAATDTVMTATSGIWFS